MAFIKRKLSNEERRWTNRLLVHCACHPIPTYIYVDEEEDVYFFRLAMGGGRFEDYIDEKDYCRLIINKKDVIYVDAWVHRFPQSCDVDIFCAPEHVDMEYVYEKLHDAIIEDREIQKSADKLILKLREYEEQHDISQPIPLKKTLNKDDIKKFTAKDFEKMGAWNIRRWLEKYGAYGIAEEFYKLTGGSCNVSEEILEKYRRLLAENIDYEMYLRKQNYYY